MRERYPRPESIREGCEMLNGEWEFAFDDEGKGHRERWYEKHEYDRRIEVPYSYESELSGIADKGMHDEVWYHREIEGKELEEEERVILHFEGVDYYSEIYVNGVKVKEHYGANGGYRADITEAYRKGKNDIVVYCWDPGKDRSIPRGKQDWEEESHGIWYTRTTGIYKPVWMEIVNEKHIEGFYIRTKLEGYEIEVDLETTTERGKIEMIVSDGRNDQRYGYEIGKKKETYRFGLPNDYVNDRVWTCERPFLYDLTMRLYDEAGKKKDEVKTYFGIREIRTENGKVLLNGRPIYQKLVLNQGYYPGGLLTAPDVETMEKDIDNMKAMGFNGCRIHQKTEDARYLYLCDKKGFLARKTRGELRARR